MAPLNKNRDYKAEAKWAASPEQKKRRAQRNAARAEAMKKGLVKKGDGKEVHHIDAPREGSLNNKKTAVVSRKKNRSIQPKRS
jgi:hypothetical protein